MMMTSTRLSSTLLLLAFLPAILNAKIHRLSLKNDARRNIPLSTFGYNAGGTLDLRLENFTVPDVVMKTDILENGDKLGEMGFTLSRNSPIATEITRNPRMCQLLQTDQGYDAVFLVFDPIAKRLRIVRSGLGKTITFCPNPDDCIPGVLSTVPQQPIEAPPEAGHEARRKERGVFDAVKKWWAGDGGKPYVDYIPLQVDDNRFSTNISVWFTGTQRGRWSFIFHNCFNYRQHGYSDRVAVDMTVDLVEMNQHSHLSAGDEPLPQLYLYFALVFTAMAFYWAQRLCLADRSHVYRVHILMGALCFLKATSLFFHGLNFYFVAKYGHQREFWAVVFYIAHLLKGALLFGTIILIGTGYSFFKDFLTERDRRLFLIVLPLQVLDNMALVIVEESEQGALTYQLWLEIFVLIDLLCCCAIITPILWSIRHLSQAASSDGKAVFNIGKLRLFRQFYLLVLSYIYITRVLKLLLQGMVPFDREWTIVVVVETSTLIFFLMVGWKFRPQGRNPYLRLQVETDDDLCTSSAVTQNGLFDGVTHRGDRQGRGEERISMEPLLNGDDDSDGVIVEDPSDGGNGSQLTSKA